MTLTACVEVMPTGLSSTSQPCTSRFSRLNCPPLPAAGGALRAPEPVIRSFTFSRLLVQVPLDRRRSQKLLDPFRFVESLINAESNVRCEFQVNAPRDLAAQEFLVALQRG